jgi:SAM-dependent methyltransferase
MNQNGASSDASYDAPAQQQIGHVNWPEVDVAIRSLDEFKAFIEANREVLLSEEAHEDLGRQIRHLGCREPLTGREIAPFEISNDGGLREGLAFNAISSRVRAVMLCMEDVINRQQLTSPRIYAAEGLTAFAMRMRGLYPRFLGSEFTFDQTRKEWMYPIPLEDLQNLSLPDGAFDIVSTNEVLEHVPSIDSALEEIARVLRSGGWHIGTVPFHYLYDKGELRATLDGDGNVVHLLEPQYHGDPMNEGGVLVFEIPAWDIIERAHRAGFKDAFMRFVVSERHGAVAEHIGGILVLCCEK